MDNSTP